MLNQNTNMFIEENAFENISLIPSLCTQSQWVDPKMIYVWEIKIIEKRCSIWLPSPDSKNNRNDIESISFRWSLYLG